MVSIQNLEIEIQELLKEKKYSEIIFQINSKTKEEDRNSGLFVLLGISRMSLNKKDKDQVKLAVRDFKKGYLKEKTSENSLNALVNFVIASAILSDFENTNVNFDEIKSFYNESPISFQNKRPINIAMTAIYKRLNNHKEMLFHLEKVINSGDFISNDLCIYGYWRCFDKGWSQKEFFEYGKFVDKNLIEYSKDKLTKLSNEKNKKIKLGILSADLKAGHSITYFLKTILLNYNKKEIEIYLFSNQIDDKVISPEITNLVYKTINIGKLSELIALNKIREFNLDIMIDVMGYTSRNRIGLFKNRIAKKQIIWMGYCNTSGLKNMDYIISDPNLIMPDEQKLYAEKVIYLPQIWNCHSGFNFERIEHPAPFKKNNYFTFGSFNNFDKVNSDVIETWSNILKHVKNSKLVLKSGKQYHSFKRVMDLFKKNNVLDSIVFLEKKKKLDDHLDTYKSIDLALDTYPYNGVTTSFEAIWMGVPVLTMAGYNFNSRCGESINKNLGIENLIAKSSEEYVLRAVDLANNQDKFLKLRKFVYRNALNTPLFDAQKFSKNFYNYLKKL